MSKVKPEEDRQERVPDVMTTLDSHSSWVCRYQVAQMLVRHKVQRISSKQMALSSRCLSRHGCMLYHYMHHAAASLFLVMLVLAHSRSAAQQQVWSCKTTAATEECKILLLINIFNVFGSRLWDRGCLEVNANFLEVTTARRSFKGRA